jgi:hypothetical protein
MRTLLILPLALLLAALAGCGAAPSAPALESPAPAADLATAVPAPTASFAPAPSPSPSSAAATPSAAATAGAASAVPADLLAKILADAAQRSGVGAAAITVQLGEAAEWPDSSLGCPKPGVAYLQVITPGYHVLLQAGTASYDYRADDRGNFVLCQR